MKSTILAATLAAFMALSSAQPTQLDGQQAHELQVEKRTLSGKMTYYSPGQGSCGVTNTDSDMIVAVSPSMYGTYANPNSSPMCQKTITIKCNGKKVKAAIKDRCAGCGADDIDVSPAVFEVCGDLSVGVMKVTWAVN